ncbi:MAG: hypothetical protein VYE15_07985, partial [Myxococcota bacterium]|nr:hypothetical protein [Myxococcota bacterium]
MKNGRTGTLSWGMVWLSALMWGGCAETRNDAPAPAEADLSTASLPLRFLEQCEAEDVNGVMLLELHPPPEGSEIAGLKDASGKPLVKEHWRAEVATAHAFCAMFNLAHDEAFGHLNLHSGFRVSGDQEHLYCCHTKCKNGGKNGCKPGCDACGD